jgi:sugar transferase (PEP-CTERM/EpsH1 system associated)
MHSQTPPLVLHVIHHLVIGGMENGLVNLINNMPASSHRHAIVCIEDYSEFRDRIQRSDVDVIALHRSRIGVWPLRRALFDLCRRLRPAIVHSRNQSGLDALLPARLAGVTHTVHSEHGWDVDNLDGRKWKPIALRRLHSPLIERYVTVSKDLEHYLVDRVRIAPSRITQIYNGVDTHRFEPAHSKPLDVLPPGFVNEHSIVIGTIGRVQAVKDHATLLRAFSALAARRPDLKDRLRLVVVGDGPLLWELRSFADASGIGTSIWLPGALDNVAQVLQTLDLFVLPSLNEGISNTVLEAMATGLPIVATAVGGNAELVEDGVNGRLFAPGDNTTLADLLAAYAADPSLRRQHSTAARHIAQDRFSLLAMTQRYAAIYDSVLRRRV